MRRSALFVAGEEMRELAERLHLDEGQKLDDVLATLRARGVSTSHSALGRYMKRARVEREKTSRVAAALAKEWMPILREAIVDAVRQVLGKELLHEIVFDAVREVLKPVNPQSGNEA
jgi:hypothetical protein